MTRATKSSEIKRKAGAFPSDHKGTNIHWLPAVRHAFGQDRDCKWTVTQHPGPLVRIQVDSQYGDPKRGLLRLEHCLAQIGVEDLEIGRGHPITVTTREASKLHEQTLSFVNEVTSDEEWNVNWHEDDESWGLWIVRPWNREQRELFEEFKSHASIMREQHHRKHGLRIHLREHHRAVCMSGEDPFVSPGSPLCINDCGLAMRVYAPFPDLETEGLPGIELPRKD